MHINHFSDICTDEKLMDGIEKNLKQHYNESFLFPQCLCDIIFPEDI